MPTLYRKDMTLQDRQGLALGGAAVYICDQPAVYGLFPRVLPAPLADVFQDAGGTVPLNPVILDGQGNGFYYAQVGSYTEIYTLANKVRKVLPDQNVGSVAAGTFNVDTVMTAGQNIGAYLVVSLHNDGLAYIASSSILADAGRIVGVATTSALAGYPLTIRTASQLDNLGFSFTPGAQQYLGLSGAIVETLNTGLFEQPLGVAQSLSRMYLEIGTPIVFA